MKMNILKRLLVLGLTLLPSSLFGATQILPAPKTIEVQEGANVLGSTIRASEAYLEQANALQQALLALTGQTFKVQESTTEKSTLQLLHNDSLKGEQYRIETTGGFVLYAATPMGMARATATLLQLVEKNAAGKWQLPRVKIKDEPDFSYRSFFVDMGRNPHSPETLRRVVDMMWLAKANYLHVHLSDDQLISFPSTAYPKLLSQNAGWTLTDWHEMESYSQARGVTLIPELDVPGHSTILRNLYPEVFGKTPTELATLESAFTGVTTILTEMMDVFKTSPYIHIGGDEAFGVDEKLQRALINRLNKFIKSKGRRTLVWEGPRLGTDESKVDEDVIHMNWNSHEFPPADMIKAGYTIINTTWDPLYIVDHYPRTMFTAVPSRNCYEFNIKRFKHIDHGFPHYTHPHFLETTDHILGFCMPWWEGREENIFPVCRQRLTAVAARTWNDKGETSFDSFLSRDAKLKTLLDTIRPWTGDAPTGGWANRMEEPTAGNLAHGKPVNVSTGESQPQFHPQRLTNGATDRFDHFLGYPTVPEPLEITIDLGKEHDISRVEIFEAAVGKSWEKYELASSTDNKTFTPIGKTEKETRGEKNSVTFKMDSRKARYLRIQTHGCQDLTFPSFSRLCEVMVFEK